MENRKTFELKNHLNLVCCCCCLVSCSFFFKSLKRPFGGVGEMDVICNRYHHIVIVCMNRSNALFFVNKLMNMKNECYCGNNTDIGRSK